MNYDIKNDLMPVGIYTCNGLTGNVSPGIDLSIPAKIQIDSATVEFSPPMKQGLLSTDSFTKKKFSDEALELMLGAGRSNDPLTQMVQQSFRLPSWVRPAAIVKFEMAEKTAIEIRPVSPDERVACARAIAELKAIPGNDRVRGEKIRQLVRRQQQFQVGNEADLAPFVSPIYPVRIEGQKALSYRVFLICVGWNPQIHTWRTRTSFEVITTTSPNGNNFICSTEFLIDADGLATSNVTLENRWVKAAKRAAELK